MRFLKLDKLLGIPYKGNDFKKKITDQQVPKRAIRLKISNFVHCKTGQSQVDKNNLTPHLV